MKKSLILNKRSYAHAQSQLKVCVCIIWGGGGVQAYKCLAMHSLEILSHDISVLKSWNVWMCLREGRVGTIERSSTQMQKWWDDGGWSTQSKFEPIKPIRSWLSSLPPPITLAHYSLLSFPPNLILSYSISTFVLHRHSHINVLLFPTDTAHFPLFHSSGPLSFIPLWKSSLIWV